MTKLWISGSSGFVGKHLQKYLNKFDKYKIELVSNSRSNEKNKIYLNYSSEKQLIDNINVRGAPDVFIHLGWGHVYDPHNEIHLSKNLKEGKKLFKCLFKCGTKKIIFIGSSSEYGGNLGYLKENLEINEFQNRYVEAKYKLSKFGLKEAAVKNKLFLHVRLFYAYGEGQRKDSLINQLYHNAIQNNLMLLTPCEHYRDYIHIDDVVMGVEKLLSFKRSQIVNIGSGNAIKLRDFVEIFWKKLNGNLSLLNFGSKILPLNQQKQPKAFADLSNLRQITNWVPKTSINQGITKTINKIKSEQI